MLPVTNAQFQQAISHRPCVTVRTHQYVCVCFYEVSKNVVCVDCARSSIHLCVTSTQYLPMNPLPDLHEIQRSNRSSASFREIRLKD